MERKNKIGISFDSSYFSQIFIHTSGAYLSKPISKNNNKYLVNLRTIPPDERFGQLVLNLENAASESEREKILNELKAITEIDKTVEAIPLTFKDNVETLKGYIVFEPMTAVEHNDLALLDFISYDFDVFNDYLLFFINFFDYFIDKLDNNDIKHIELDTLYPVSEVVEIAKKYYDKEKGNLIYYQSLFKKCINFVYKIDNPFDMKYLTHKQIFFLYNQLYQDTFAGFKQDFHSTDLLDYQYNDFPMRKEEIRLEDIFTLISAIEKIDPTGRKLNSLQQFETTNLFTSFYITLFNVVAVNKMNIKICGNCGRYFITHKETVTYCDRIIENKLTCKDIGNKEYQKRKLENDTTYEKYRKIGSRKKLRATRNPKINIYQKDLEQYRKIGKQMYKDVCSGKITNEEFAKWVDEQDK
ncbi:MAG: hypothetical protein IJ220_04565 [Clostridia bacterium]|nr:hypothetical protein [Clostridia bacterium]